MSRCLPESYGADRGSGDERRQPAVPNSAGRSTYNHYAALVRTHRLWGDWTSEQAASRFAFEVARAGGLESTAAMCLMDAAFGAWVAGADEIYEDYIAALEANESRNPSVLIRHFVDCARGRTTVSGPILEGHEVLASANLIAASLERDECERIALVRVARDLADRCGRPYLRILARVAAWALDCDANVNFEEAEALALSIPAPRLRECLRSLLRGDSDDALATFIARMRPPQETVFVHTLSDEVRVNGRPRILTNRDREVLCYVALACHRVLPEEAMAAIWPDADAEAARSRLKVAISRLRASFGKDIILWERGAYVLGPRVRVDVREIKTSLQHAFIDQRACDVYARAFHSLVNRVPGRDLRWEWFGPVELKLAELTRASGLRLVALLRESGNMADATDVARTLVERDPLDERARESLVQLLLLEGREVDARREISRYETALLKELDVQGPSQLRQLLPGAVQGPRIA